MSGSPPVGAAAPEFGARPPKIVQHGYAPGPFFNADRGADATGLVAWTPDVEQLGRLVDRVLATLPGAVRVEVRVRSPQGTEGWRRHGATTDAATVRRAIAEHAAPALQDGDSQLAVRSAGDGTSLVLDDLGVLRLSPASPALERACTETGFARREQALPGRGRHWRQSVPDAARQELLVALHAVPDAAVSAREGKRLERRRRGARFATVLWGGVGGLLVCLGTNDVIRGVEGPGIGVLAIVALAGGTMLVHAAVRLGLGELRRQV